VSKCLTLLESEVKKGQSSKKVGLQTSKGSSHSRDYFLARDGGSI